MTTVTRRPCEGAMIKDRRTYFRLIDGDGEGAFLPRHEAGRNGCQKASGQDVKQCPHRRARGLRCNLLLRDARELCRI